MDCIINISLVTDLGTQEIVNIVSQGTTNNKPFYTFQAQSDDETLDLILYFNNTMWIVASTDDLTESLWELNTTDDCPIGVFTPDLDFTTDIDFIVSESVFIINTCNDSSFQPKIDVCINNKCDSLCIKEVTDIRQDPYNSTGWGNPNISTNDIDSAKVEIYTLSGSLIATYTMKNVSINVYPNNTPTPFVAYSNASWGGSDGVYQILYSITTDATAITYTNGTQHSLFLCNLQSCLNKLIQRVIKECDQKKIAKDKEIIDQLEIIVYGIKSAFSCRDFSKTTLLLAEATKLCSNTGCGCKDCDC